VVVTVVRVVVTGSGNQPKPLCVVVVVTVVVVDGCCEGTNEGCVVNNVTIENAIRRTAKTFTVYVS